MLNSCATNSFLACDHTKELSGACKGFATRGVGNKNPTISTVFILKRAGKDFFKDNLVHYG